MSDDLIKQLRSGLIEYDKRWSGDTHFDKGGPVDYEATDALMAEAAAEIERLRADNERLRDFWVGWARKRLEIQRKHYLRDAKLALNGDTRALRNRIEMMETEPMPIVASGAAVAPT